MNQHYDIAIVGAGICGLAHALAAAKRGKRCVVLERNLAATGASIRNFGFITVTGQEKGACWQRARRTRDIWSEISQAAHIPITQRQLLVLAQYPEALNVLEAFADDEMGSDCTLLTPQNLRSYTDIKTTALHGALLSPYELRVESRDAIPQLTRWLAEQWGVTILWGTTVHAVEPPTICTNRGVVHAEQVVICPGDDLQTLFPERLAQYGLKHCTLQMMRLASGSYHAETPAIMSDLGVGRYKGYHHLAGHAALIKRLQRDKAAAFAAGVHLIAVRSADGSQIVGDSHIYADKPDPFSDAGVDELILTEHATVFQSTPPVTSRWSGCYTSGPDTMLTDRVSDTVRIVLITSGTGASTSFAIAEETLADLWGSS
ncbi:FAD dependent oxidoreductase [Neokomagataea thailandica NBRC 106555]|uniref:TIGR03364 family FAD-dependent oxidoreductase n=2 Tax=Neokomagataea TaxID=1223423 RepID=A0A4Y6V885_9PROT|nr:MULTISPECIES: TIGR03364 family FAD-dependent oxidoreductase [Neokomagataea]QDH24851.1 TIGR03364 family FAD-dependent oxidoreductase [Neokomagataea tanensis]GBR50142.1 FAD dependent oxidoreductase [Neokomagataea thailandica NBRC 106555]